jgi:hypothetical protein
VLLLSVTIYGGCRAVVNMDKQGDYRQPRGRRWRRIHAVETVTTKEALEEEV